MVPGLQAVDPLVRMYENSGDGGCFKRWRGRLSGLGKGDGQKSVLRQGQAGRKAGACSQSLGLEQPRGSAAWLTFRSHQSESEMALMMGL